MAKVKDLVPGDRVVGVGGFVAVFVAQTDHPLYPALRLVVWRVWQPEEYWSFDALSAEREVGAVALEGMLFRGKAATDEEERKVRLHRVLTPLQV